MVVSEDDHAGGATLYSGRDGHTALSVRRTRINVAKPEVALGFGYKPGYVLRLHLKSHHGSTIAHGKKQLEVPPRRVAETSFREVRRYRQHRRELSPMRMTCLAT
jgi:hypothetical protein